MIHSLTFAAGMQLAEQPNDPVITGLEAKTMIDGNLAMASERVYQGPHDYEPDSQSELIEPLGACRNFWCEQYECKGKYYDKCRDYTP